MTRDLLPYLDSNYFVSSKAGQLFFAFASSMIFRSFELFYQGTKYPLNFTGLPPKIKALINLSTVSAILGLSLYLGYNWEYISVIAFPIIIEKFLSFTWSNYFKQIKALSSTKNFEFKDFIVKNIQYGSIHILLVIFPLLYNPQPFIQYFTTYQPAQISVCPIEEKFSVNFHQASSTIEEFLLEPFALILGKMCIDLAYIFLLKMFSKDVDLRDPMGWILSRLRRPPILKIFKKPEVSHCPTSITSNTKKSKKPFVSRDQIDEPIDNKAKPETPTVKKLKVKTKGTPSITSPEPIQTPIKPINRIEIEAGDCLHIFQKLENSTLNKETWGIIIAPSVEKQKLAKYERLLSNGSIGGGIRQLTGCDLCYEIGANMDSRLIGKTYDKGIYVSLQKHMLMEEALPLSQELERNGIPDDVLLIVFSKEAKTHKDISRVAKSL